MTWPGAPGKTHAQTIIGVAVLAAASMFVARLSIAAGPAVNPHPEEATPWKAGLARAVVTPEKGVWLAGYGSKRPPDGKLYDLWVKVLALEDPKGRRAVLITSDFQRVPKGMSDRVFERIERTFGITRHQAMFAVNRRNNREAEVRELLAQAKPLKGPVDHAVPILRVSRPDGDHAAVLFGYACHPTTLSFTKWCGDYPGFAQLEIERAHPGAMALFVNTCGGDQNPLPRRSVELCERYGHMLAGAVEEGLKEPMKPISPSLVTAFETIELPYLKVVSREELTAALQARNAILARWAGRMLRKLDAGETFPSSYPYPVHA
jgi:hypothetical protein